ncbi:hypothetical protein ACWCOT_45195 [Nonomuraea bangladeshensis]
MPRDFYATVAQVLPVLLLAFVWDSRFLERLRTQRRHLRPRGSADGVRFWTKPRVRAYALTVATITIADLAVCILALAGAIPDSTVLRTLVAVGLILALITLLNRVWMDVLHATARSVEPSSPPDGPLTISTDQAAEGSGDQPDASPPSSIGPGRDGGTRWEN